MTCGPLECSKKLTRFQLQEAILASRKQALQAFLHWRGGDEPTVVRAIAGLDQVCFLSLLLREIYFVLVDNRFLYMSALCVSLVSQYRPGGAEHVRCFTAGLAFTP